MTFRRTQHRRRPPDLTVTLSTDSKFGIRRARSAMRTFLAAKGRADEDALLVTSELVTNSIVHAGGVRALHAWLERGGTRLRIEVIDDCLDPPRVKTAAATGGRGLGIIDAVSSGAWGFDVGATSKRVWCELPLAVPRPGKTP
jgi:anti-sigma regulatory factor (Ser/Thr protein kinase)